RARGAVPLGVGRGHVVRVARQPVADDLRVAPRVAADGVLERLEHDDPTPLAADEPVAAGVEGPRGLRRRVVARGHRLHRAEARDRQRDDDGLGAARDHDVRVAPLDEPEGVADRVVAGRAGGDDRGVRPLRAEAHRHEPRRHVHDHHRDEERRHAVRPLLAQGLVVREQGLDAADPRADQHPEAVAVHPRGVEARVLDGHHAAGHRVLEERVEAPRLLLVHVLERVEVPHLARDPRRVEELALGVLDEGVELRDGADARPCPEERGPELVGGVPHRRERSEPRDDDAPRVHDLGVVLDVLDRVADRHDLLGVLVRNLDVEMLLESHDELNRVERVSAQVFDELRVRGDLVFLHSELLDDDLLHLLLHRLRHEPVTSTVEIRYMYSPPLTWTTWPVMYAAPSPARNRTTSATSRGVPIRLSGTSASSSARASGEIPAVISVSMSPGATALTRMDQCASSRAVAFVNPMRPALAAEQFACPALPMAPGVDPMLITRPPLFCRIISFVAARVRRNAPRRLTSMTWSQSSSFMRTRRPSRMTPALLTRMSTRPNRCLAASTNRSASSRITASATTPRTAPPCASSSFAERWSRSASRPETTTAAPSSASNAAIARPMPRPPPVTIATRPSRAPFVIGSPRLRLSPARPRSRARLDRRERLLEPCRVFDREPPGAVD